MRPAPRTYVLETKGMKNMAYERRRGLAKKLGDVVDRNSSKPSVGLSPVCQGADHGDPGVVLPELSLDECGCVNSLIVGTAPSKVLELELRR